MTLIWLIGTLFARWQRIPFNHMVLASTFPRSDTFDGWG
jgi:hypothetical protein